MELQRGHRRGRPQHGDASVPHRRPCHSAPRLRGGPVPVIKKAAGGALGGCLVGLLAASSMIGSCKSESDETRIRVLIEAVIEAANDRRTGDVFNEVADNFQGPQGMGLQETRRYLTGFFLQKGWVHIFSRNLEIQVNGTQATVLLDTVLARGPEVQRLTDLLPQNAGGYLFRIRLRMQSGEWQITQADYTAS
jgi:hypothetical protein